MLFYLDNWLSVGPNSDAALGHSRTMPVTAARPPARDRPSRERQAQAESNGLNENYGRELMELHTLSVNGGYSQQDVTEVARVFTGWTIDKPNDGGGFHYEPRMHEPGDKIVLGHRIKPKGEEEGSEVLHLLAHQPADRALHFAEAGQRFVSDNPPPPWSIAWRRLPEERTATFAKCCATHVPFAGILGRRRLTAPK